MPLCSLNHFLTVLDHHANHILGACNYLLWTLWWCKWCTPQYRSVPKGTLAQCLDKKRKGKYPCCAAVCIAHVATYCCSCGCQLACIWQRYPLPPLLPLTSSSSRAFLTSEFIHCLVEYWWFWCQWRPAIRCGVYRQRQVGTVLQDENQKKKLLQGFYSAD